MPLTIKPSLMKIKNEQGEYVGFNGVSEGDQLEKVVETVEDWLDENISGESEVVIDTSLAVSGAAADSKTVGDELASIKNEMEGGSITQAIKDALLQLARKVAYIDNGGDGYYSDLYNALYPHQIDVDYIKSGLIHYYDAINNTRNGHSSSATVWDDLVGINKLTPDSTSAISWSADALVLSGTALQRLVDSQDATDATNKTVEVVFTITAAQTSVLVNAFYDSTDTNVQNRRAFGSVVLYSDNSFNVIGRSETSYTTGVGAMTGLHHIAGTFSGASTVSAAYANGVSRTKGSTTHSMRAVNTKMTVGATADIGEYPFTGKIHAIRIYNRVLTATEIAHNYAVDVERFELA